MRQTRVFQNREKDIDLKHLFEDEEDLDLTDEEAESLGIEPKKHWIVDPRYDDLFI